MYHQNNDSDREIRIDPNSAEAIAQSSIFKLVIYVNMIVSYALIALGSYVVHKGASLSAFLVTASIFANLASMCLFLPPSMFSSLLSRIRTSQTAQSLCVGLLIYLGMVVFFPGSTTARSQSRYLPLLRIGTFLQLSASVMFSSFCQRILNRIRDEQRRQRFAREEPEVVEAEIPVAEAVYVNVASVEVDPNAVPQSKHYLYARTVDEEANVRPSAPVEWNMR